MVVSYTRPQEHQTEQGLERYRLQGSARALPRHPDPRRQGITRDPARVKGQRGRIAKSDAHNLHERQAKHEEAVLHFLHEPAVSFTNDFGERGLLIATVKMKESCCFRTPAYGESHARLSSYLHSMATLGCNRLVAIQIALAGQAADTINQHYGPAPTDAQVAAKQELACSSRHTANVSRLRD